jgi:hypothetical protein
MILMAFQSSPIFSLPAARPVFCDGCLAIMTSGVFHSAGFLARTATQIKLDSMYREPRHSPPGT